MSSLADRITAHTARCCVVGGGYVGLPLAISLAKRGFPVVVLDHDEVKVAALREGRSYLVDIEAADFAPLFREGRLEATTDDDALASADVVCVCVPTPLNKSRDPDVSALLSVAEALRERLRPGMLVSLESTTYPGFTREAFVPLVSSCGLEVGKDFFVTFSPERIDPGNEDFGLRTTPRVVGGTTDECLRHGTLLYEQVVDRVVPVSTTDAAEMVKLLENTFRVVNIGLVNEVALMCHRLGVDTWEVIDAAASKPFGFMPFYPGPGVGGHCIPVDPHYLSWKLRSLKYYSRFIELAGEINSKMPQVVVERAMEALNEDEKSMKGSKVLVVGVAYKPNVADVRESPSLDVIELLVARGARVDYLDPFVDPADLDVDGIGRIDPGDSFSSHDCAVIVTHHDGLDYERLVREVPRIVDTRNVTRGLVPELEDRVTRI